MSYLHLVFGIILFIVFLITGKFMRADFPDKELIPQDFRLLMRSRHIYILLSSLIHIVLGIYLQISKETWRKILQIFASILLFAGTFCSFGHFSAKLTRQKISPTSADWRFICLWQERFFIFSADFG